jgi:MerR family redox-sensitive transcriptional activator SoxR
MPALLTIGEVARCTGVSTSAIRYYEEAGLLSEPERVGGKRRYEKEILRRLALIRGAKRAGFTLGEIRTLLHGFPAGTGAAERWQAHASKKLVEVD